MEKRSVEVISFGEALVDMLEAWSDGQLVYVPKPGGSPLNVAAGLARLGVSVELVTAFGGDPLGGWLREFLREEGVSLSASRTSQRSTTIAMTTFEAAEPHFTFYGTPASYGAVDTGSLPEARVRDASVVHAGSIGLLEPRMYELVARAFSIEGPLRAIDPNVRLSLIDDLDGYVSAMEALFARADLVKLSAMDALGMYPELDIDQVMDRIVELGASTVVVTLGAQGLRSRRRGVDEIVAAPPIEAIDTSGAGDSCMAALIHGVVRHGADADPGTWRRILESAVETAAWTCRHPGGASGMPYAADVKL